MELRHSLVSRTSSGSATAGESSVRAAARKAHRGHNPQPSAGVPPAQVRLDFEFDGRGEGSNADFEESDNFTGLQQPSNKYDSLNDTRTQVDEYFGSRPHEQLPGLPKSYGTDRLGGIQTDSQPARRAVFEPVPPPEGYSPLSFRPTLLQTKWAVTLAILYIAIATCIYTLLRASGPDYLFTVSNENVHLIARYGPGLTATLTVLFFRQTLRDAIRLKPFFEMADQKDIITQGADPKQSVAGSYFPFQALFLTPTSFISVFLFLVQFVVSFLVAFKSILLGTEQSGSDWKVSVRSSAAIYLIAGYSLMALVNVVIIIWAWSRSTGLKWDPVSLSDHFALFARCNALDSFRLLEPSYEDEKFGLFREKLAFKTMSSLTGFRFRIGYWISRNLPPEPEENATELSSEIVYGIGLMNDDEPVSIPGTKAERKQYLRAKVPPDVLSGHNLQSGTIDRAEQETDNQMGLAGATHAVAEFCGCKNHSSCQHYPYRVSTGLQLPFLFIWIVIAASASFLCIFGIASGAVVRGEFSIDAWTHVANSSSVGNITLTSSEPWYNTQSGSMLVYAAVFRALPTQLAGQFAIGYLPTIDTHLRFTQPFVGMFDNAGDAANTIGLSYLTVSSLKVPLDAFDKGHWKVAWFSILATMAPAFPIFVSALFTITESGSKVYFALDWPTFAIVTSYILVFTVSLPLAWPTRSRRQPQHSYSLANIMGMCHQARFLADPLFDIASPASSKEKMDARLLLRENKYLFGHYLGRDGKAHLGFDVAETDVGGPTGTVAWIPPKPGYVREADRKPSAFTRLFQRKHRRLEQEDPEDGIKMRHVRNRSGPSNVEQHDPSEWHSRSTAIQAL